MSNMSGPSTDIGTFFGVTLEAVADVLRCLEPIMKTGRYSVCFAIEIAYHASARHYNINAIYEEIAILEETSTRQSVMKPAAPFHRQPLIGYHHKHHYQNVYLYKNIWHAWKKDNKLDDIIAKFIGKNIADMAGQLAYDITFGAITDRGRSGAMTGEFFVFEKMNDGSNYYLTLGSHKEDHITKMKIDLFKSIDDMIRSQQPNTD